MIVEGRQRIFLTSLNGGEITLYRLLPGDVCILSAACMIKNLNLETHVEYEEDTTAYFVPKQLFKTISDQNPQVKEYVLELVSEKLCTSIFISILSLSEDCEIKYPLLSTERSIYFRKTKVILL